MENLFPEGIEVATFSVRSSLWPFPLIPKHFNDTDLEQAFVKHRHSLLRRRFLFGLAVILLIWMPRAIMDYIAFSRDEWASRASILDFSTRIIAMGFTGSLFCSSWLYPEMPLEKMTSGLVCVATVWVLLLSKPRSAWLCGETIQEAFNTDVQSDSLTVAWLMTIGSLFFQLPVRVTRSFMVVAFLPAAYLVGSLPVPGLDGHIFRVATLGALLPCLTGSMFINQIMSEMNERASFAHMVVLQKQVTKERVLRYQAEHEAELGPLSSLHGAGRPHAPPAAIPVQDQRSELSSLKPHSAPATYLPRVALPCNSGDCVPEDYLVEAPSSSTPQRVSSISVGQEVLCYDRLNSQTHFVKITGSNIVETNSVLCAISLEDGTVVEATPDHPMPAGESNSTGRISHRSFTVAAAKLQAGVHTLTCLKRMDLAVTSVDQRTACKKVVTLSVQQPDRYGILMSSPLIPADCNRSMLVFGSSDAMTTQLQSKNTFLNIDMQSELSSVTMKRSSSAPAIMGQTVHDEAADDVKTSASLPPQQHCVNQSWRKCKICNFYRRHQKGLSVDPCVKGDSCSFCHHD